MGFVTGLLGAQNDFKATAPVNTFQATPAQLQTNDFASALQRSLAGGSQGPVADQQTQLAQALMARANGTGGPSLAEQQLQQTLQQNQQQTAGTIASTRGINPALAARLAAQTGAGLGQQAAGQGAMLRSGEQMGAQGLLAQALAAQRSGDINQLGTLAGAQQGQNSLALQNSLGTQGINYGVAAGNQQAELSAQGINAGVASQNAGINAGVIGGVIGGAGSVLSAGMGKASGGPVPGNAATPGDSRTNDTVPAMLSPGEIVIPRSVAQAEDAPEKAAAFVRAIRRQHQEPEGYGHALRRVRELDGRLKRVEAMCKGGMVPRMAEGGEVKTQAPSFGDALKRLFSHSPGPQNSSPSVFDAASAIKARNQKLQEAAEAR